MSVMKLAFSALKTLGGHSIKMKHSRTIPKTLDDGYLIAYL